MIDYTAVKLAVRQRNALIKCDTKENIDVNLVKWKLKGTRNRSGSHPMFTARVLLQLASSSPKSDPLPQVKEAASTLMIRPMAVHMSYR